MFNRIRCNAGNKKAHVLPDPVLAMDMTSFDFNNIGHDCDCVGVGDVNPSFNSTLFSSGAKGAVSKFNNGANVSSLLIFPTNVIYL